MAELTQRIIAELEEGVKPWVREWNPDKCLGPQSPFNPVTGSVYHGINVLILGMDLRAFRSGDPRWVTYQQAHEKSWQVRKGEKSTTIFFTKKHQVDDKDADEEDGKKTVRVLKHYAVFHATQIEGIPPYRPPPVEEAPWQRPEAADIILRNSGALIRIGGDRAFYSPYSDHIQLPPESAFRGPREWAVTALHELTHWTGHKSRLDRDQSATIGSAKYADEELIAEIGSAFVSIALNIPTELTNHVSYIDHWLTKLRNDKKAIFRAAAAAQHASDFILGFHPEYAAKMASDPHRPESPATIPAASDIDPA